MQERLFVPTNRHGVQHDGEAEVHWSLPDDDGSAPGEAVEAPGGGSLRLLEAGALLDNLEERIFVAEPLDEGGDALDGVVQASRVRLARETDWSAVGAARFSLDCAEHILPIAGDVKLPSGASLADVISAARQALDGEAEHGGVFHRFSKIAAGRRLRHQSEEVGDEAFAITIDHEAEDSEALDDPKFGILAAVREAVLSAVEAVQHGAAPRRLSADSSIYNVYPSTNRVPGYLSAKSCAERAREAAAASGGSEDEERGWQAAQLLGVLGEA